MAFSTCVSTVFAFILMSAVMFLPESPRLLVMKGRNSDVANVLSALRDLQQSDPQLQRELADITNVVTEAKQGSFRELFTMKKEGRHLHRTTLACLAQVFRQICGINLVTYFLPGMTGYMLSFMTGINGTVHFMASFPAIFLIEKAGRRPLMLTGSAGMSAAMLGLFVSLQFFDKGREQAGRWAFALPFVFNTFYAIGWLGTAWLYPAEIVPTRIRAPATALSTSANWLFNFMVVMISPVAFSTIGSCIYFIFFVINLVICAVVYHLFPETKGRQLEEMDVVFARSGWCSVVPTATTKAAIAAPTEGDGKRTSSSTIRDSDDDVDRCSLDGVGEREEY